MLGNIIGNIYGITLGIDIGTDLGSLDLSLDIYNYYKLEVLLLGSSLRFTDGKVHGSDKGTKLGLFYGKVIGTILGNVDGITLRFDFGTEMVSIDVFFDGYNDGNI